MWNKKLKEIPLNEKVLLLSKPKGAGYRCVVIAELTEYKGKKMLMYPGPYLDLMKDGYWFKNDKLSNFEAWMSFNEYYA